jgi:Flp pilus assembly protein TadD
MELPTDDGYVEAMLDLVHIGRAQGAPNEALNILSALTLARPDDPRLYRALGILYRELGRPADAARCSEEAARLSKEENR